MNGRSPRWNIAVKATDVMVHKYIRHILHDTLNEANTTAQLFQDDLAFILATNEESENSPRLIVNTGYTKYNDETKKVMEQTAESQYR